MRTTPRPAFSILTIIVGLGMIGWWSFAITTDQIPELATAPFEVYLHLTAEFSTALLLVIGGVAALRKCDWAGTVHTFSLGMVLYAVIQASGYYIQRSQWGFVIMFGLIAVFALTGLRQQLRPA